MAKLIPQANKMVAQSLKEKSTKAFYLSMREMAEKNYETVFATDMQNYITRLGLILAKAYNQQLHNNTFLGSIDFICNTVLKDKQLYQLMRAISINENANSGKHSLNNVDVYIKECLHQYNSMITKIVKVTKLDAFNVCYLNYKPKSRVRDVPIIDEKRHHVYGCLSKVNYQIKLSPDYEVDQYKKQLKSKITVYWPDAHSNTYLDVTVTNALNHRKLGEANKLSLSNSNDKKAIALTLKESDLDRRVLKVSVELKLYAIDQKERKVGLFRRTEYYTVRRNIDSTTEELSQFYRPTNK